MNHINTREVDSFSHHLISTSLLSPSLLGMHRRKKTLSCGKKKEDAVRAARYDVKEGGRRKVQQHVLGARGLR